jgi:hypothetical protein
MKGKKADLDFVSKYIAESAREGIMTPKEILLRAKKSIEQIDKDIQAIAYKKILRGKLLDVIATFDKDKV